jgi:hypothetical protein
VLCEITCIDIKASSTDSLKMLVFKFTNNMQKDKVDNNLGGANELMFGLGAMGEASQARDGGFDYCKQETGSSVPEEHATQ